MGFALSWLGVKNTTPRVVQEALDLTATRRHEEIPDSPLTGLDLPSGWYLVIANNQPPSFFAESAIKRLSAHCEAVICFVEEHVMYSSATGWKNGFQVWAVRHDAQIGVEHLEALGDPPSNFTTIRDRLRALQVAAGGKNADVDHTFDIPVQLAYSLTGYRHDQDIPELTSPSFEILANKK